MLEPASLAIFREVSVQPVTDFNRVIPADFFSDHPAVLEGDTIWREREGCAVDLDSGCHGFTAAAVSACLAMIAFLSAELELEPIQ